MLTEGWSQPIADVDVWYRRGGSGLGNPQMLAEGISEALYNTAGGLLVAIPCIIANNHFRNRVERLLHWNESCVGEIVRRAGV